MSFSLLFFLSPAATCYMVTVNTTGTNPAADGTYMTVGMNVSWAPHKLVYKHLDKDLYIFYVNQDYGWSIGTEDYILGTTAYLISGTFKLAQLQIALPSGRNY